MLKLSVKNSRRPNMCDRRVRACAYRCASWDWLQLAWGRRQVSCVCWAGFQGVASELPIMVSRKLPPPTVCLIFVCLCLSWVDFRSALPLEIAARRRWCCLIGDEWVQCQDKSYLYMECDIFLHSSSVVEIIAVVLCLLSSSSVK